jgi:hypothetical protein
MASGEIEAVGLRSVHMRENRDELAGGEVPLK